jgi:hypothetical protein
MQVRKLNAANVLRDAEHVLRCSEGHLTGVELSEGEHTTLSKSPGFRVDVTIKVAVHTETCMKEHLQASTHSSKQLQHCEHWGRVVEELVGNRQGRQGDDLSLDNLQREGGMSKLRAQGSSCTVDPDIILT